MARGYNPYYGDEPRSSRLGTPRIRFGVTELRHIGLAMLGLTVGFAYLLAGEPRELSLAARTVDLFERPYIIVASLLAVGTGFVLHELAHKFVAQRYGLWAEFRAQWSALGLSLLIVAFMKILVAAPGAVVIYGSVTKRENAAISIVGPGTNFVLAAALGWIPGLFVTPTDPLPYTIAVIALVNVVLAAFNLLPFGPFDGKKIWNWNKMVWVASAIAALAMLAWLFLTLQDAVFREPGS